MKKNNFKTLVLKGSGKLALRAAGALSPTLSFIRAIERCSPYVELSFSCSGNPFQESFKGHYSAFRKTCALSAVSSINLHGYCLWEEYWNSDIKQNLTLLQKRREYRNGQVILSTPCPWWWFNAFRQNTVDEGCEFATAQGLTSGSCDLETCADNEAVHWNLSCHKSTWT